LQSESESQSVNGRDCAPQMVVLSRIGSRRHHKVLAPNGGKLLAASCLLQVACRKLQAACLQLQAQKR